jgi:hypothetical protein
VFVPYVPAIFAVKRLLITERNTRLTGRCIKSQ